MNSQMLAILEEASESYRKAGFVITSQSEGAITLIYPSQKFSYVAFILWLVLFWPIAAIYLLTHSNQKNMTVCIRITSQGFIEESGYTLKVIESERRRNWWFALIAIAIFVLITLVILVRFLLATGV